MIETPERKKELDALRVALAKALGWHVTHFMHWRVYQLTLKDQLIATRGSALLDSVADAFNFWFAAGTIPDWPRDVGSAYTLCCNILTQLNAGVDYYKWVLEVSEHCVRIYRNSVALGGINYQGFKVEGNGAESLSQLALAVLAVKDE